MRCLDERTREGSRSRTRMTSDGRGFASASERKSRGRANGRTMRGGNFDGREMMEVKVEGMRERLGKRAAEEKLSEGMGFSRRRGVDTSPLSVWVGEIS